MKAVILVGGYATRLKDITHNGAIAKTMLPITAEGKTQPILYFILDKICQTHVIKDNFDEIIVITNDKYIDQIKDACNRYAWQPPFPKKLTVMSDGSNSPENMLGAIGTLRLVNSIIDDSYTGDIMVLAGDNYFDFDLNDLVKFHRLKTQANHSKKCVNTIVSKVYPETEKEHIANKFGILDVGNHNLVKSLDEKPSVDEMKSTNVSLAVYLFNRTDFNSIEDYLAQPNLTAKQRDSLGFFINYIIKNTKTYTFEFDGNFIDIGTPDDYRLMSSGKTLKNGRTV